MFKTPAPLIAAAIAATGTLALPAAAAAVPEAVTVAVRHGDLDLATQDGQVELQRRLDRAARQVCRFPTNQTLMSTQDQASCYRKTRRTTAVQFAETLADQQVARGG